MFLDDSLKVTVQIKYGRIFKYRIDINSHLEKFKTSFCNKIGLRVSSMKFFFNGQRIQDQDTVRNLGLMDGDIIDVFNEMIGGGMPKGKDISEDPKQILDVLDTLSTSEDECSSDENNDYMKNSIKDGNQMLEGGDKYKCHEQLTNLVQADDLSVDEGQIRTNHMSKTKSVINHDDAQSKSNLMQTETIKKETDYVFPVNDQVNNGNLENREHVCHLVHGLTLTVDLGQEEDIIQDIGICQRNAEDLGPLKNLTTIDNPNQSEKIIQTNTLLDTENDSQLINVSHDKEKPDSLYKDEDAPDENMEWLDKLRKKTSFGKLTQKNSLDKKISFFLQLPELAPVEIDILKRLIEQKEALNSWGNEIQEDDYKKQENREKNEVKSINSRNNKCKFIKEKIATNINVDISDLQATEEIDESFLSCVDQSPEQRKHLLTAFRLRTPSPLIKMGKIKEEEMRRFSLACHLWAEKKCGSMKFLKQVRLTDKHFKNILDFAGPYSKYNFIKDRSSLQYKNLWRNTANSTDVFRGHPMTGFETDSKLHNSSPEFCPFEHCNTQLGPLRPLDIDLVMLTPKKRKCETSTNRKLFEREKSNENIESEQMFKHPTHFEEEGQVLVKQSPTKEELKRQNRLLIQEIKLVKNKLWSENKTPGEKKNEIVQPCKTLVKCRVEICGKEFETMFGLIKHTKKHHSEENFRKINEVCKFCGKEVFYIDKHIKAVHKDSLVEEICDICGETVNKSMKKHRGVCVSCPSCGYRNLKKMRLLKHIKVCRQNKISFSEQIEPLDLTSPVKQDVERYEENTEQDVKELSSSDKDIDQPRKDNIQMYYSQCKENLKPTMHDTSNACMEDNDNETDKETYSKEKDVVSAEVYQECLNIKRTHFPFDDKKEEENYLSEFEDKDSEDYTKQRRMNKDELERKLREVDDIPNYRKEGDDEIIRQFRCYMEAPTNNEHKEDGYSHFKEASTTGMYARAIEVNLLPAFHELFKPFDSRWLIDCTTSKNCLFEGEERCFVSPEEPIYLTSRVLQKALEKYDNHETGGQRATFMAATMRFLNFIEMHFNCKLNLYGREPLKKVITYHGGLKSFITGMKTWKTCHEEQRKSVQTNKVLKEFENPNYEAEILERYQKFINGPERLSQIRKVLKYSSESVDKPDEKVMTEITNIVMGEIICSTGKRPVVVYRLTVGAFVGKKTGFNPREVTEEDCEIEEELGDKKIYRRLNPNLPPKHLACKHQLQYKTAKCLVGCKDECEPEGFNILVDWDKTQSTMGSSYLHIVKPIKDLMDRYDLIKTKYFQGRKSPKTNKENWIDDENTPFFLNSSGSPFQTISMKHLSDAMDIDVTSYSFRRIVSTWSLSHKDEVIRKAEEDALQHSLKVATNDYLQNKEINPQLLTQKYNEEENLFPEEVRNEIKVTEKHQMSKISKTEEKRQKLLIATLQKGKKAAKQKKQKNKPLGPKHRILGNDRQKFREFIEDLTGERLEDTLKLKPLPWRNFILRTICSAEDKTGEDVRNLWVKVYKGDLRWGVRDVRLRAQSENWPRKDSNAYLQNNDRNSWIASSLRKSLQVEAKYEVKRN